MDKVALLPHREGGAITSLLPRDLHNAILELENACKNPDFYLSRYIYYLASTAADHSFSDLVLLRAGVYTMFNELRTGICTIFIELS